jgi:hypothetical protein
MVKEQGEIPNNPEVNDEEGESEKEDNEYNSSENLEELRLKAIGSERL